MNGKKINIHFWVHLHRISLVEHFVPQLYTLLLLLLLKEVGSARLGERDLHPISTKIPCPQYQPIDRTKRRGKVVDDNNNNNYYLVEKDSGTKNCIFQDLWSGIQGLVCAYWVLTNKDRQHRPMKKHWPCSWPPALVSRIVPQGHWRGIKVLWYCEVLCEESHKCTYVWTEQHV